MASKKSAKYGMDQYLADPGLPPESPPETTEPAFEHPEDAAVRVEGIAYGKEHGSEFFRCHLTQFQELVATYGDGDAQAKLDALRELFWARIWVPESAAKADKGQGG